MRETRVLEFAPFRLDLGAERLWRDARAVQLTAKAFAVLRYLVMHAGHLITRDELFEVVWASPAVSEAALNVCIGEIRRALGDAAQTPQFLETVRGRGYRFCAPVRVVAQAPVLSMSGPPPVAVPRPRLLVGREAEMAQLQRWWVQALQGKRQVGFVTGEAGIGKTTLVDAFVAQVAATAPVWIGRGQCIQQYGAGEAYLPLLEALGHVGRDPEGARLVELLRQQAPSWLLQMPSLVSEEVYETLHRRVDGMTRARMLRELAEAVEVLTTEQPLVLVLEDLHWSDAATLDWLAYVARRRQAARLLVIGTYRSMEARVHRHPVYPITQDLLLHDQGVEVGVGYWPVADVITYLAWRFEALSLPVGLAEMLHRRTNGNPLFLVTVVDELVRQGVVREGPKGWELYGGLEAVAGWVPERLQQLIERQGEQLTAEEQRLLEVASVAGVEFATATVAVGLGGDVDAVEERCASLAHREQFLRAAGTDIWPDGTITACYGFRHALYQEVFYAHVPARRRARWHGQMGVRLEAGYGEKAQTVAAALAEHFVQGRETVRAVPYLRCAGDQAMQRSAYQEAIRHLTRALALLPTLPETPERLQQELEIHLTLGPAWMAGKGYTTPEVVATYTRALALSQQHGTLPQRFAVLRVLRRVHTGRAEMPQAHAVGDALLTLAQQCNTTAYLLEAHMGVGTTWLHMGRLERARHHLETALTFYKTAEHRHHAVLYGHEPGVACLAQLSRLLWFRGYPDQARQRSQEALALAQEVAHPYSLDFALLHANWLAHYLREVQTLQAQTETTMRLAHEAGLGIANATLLRGWALVMQGQGTEGIAQLHQGMARQQALGEALPQPYYAALLAEAYQQLGQPEAGVSSVEDALTAVYTHGHHFYTAELHRLQGILILQAAGSRPASEPARRGDPAQCLAQRAEACLCQALEVARGQQAKSLELRAAMSLARLWQQQDKLAEARELLAPLYGWFTEGFDTADLQEARALLDELGG